MLEAYFLPVSIRLIDAILSGIYNQNFLSPKHGKKITLISWALIFFLIGIFLLEPYTSGGLTCILTYIIAIFLLQALFFQKDYAKLLFVNLTFVAGKYIINYIICVIFIYIGEITNIIVNYFISNEYIKTLEQAKVLTQTTNLIHFGITVLIYAVIFSFYLFFISKKYVCQNHSLNFKESAYLVFPCVTSLFIYITLRKLILTVENGRTYLIFDTLPETKIWVATISFLLLGTIIATDILFQYFVQYNEESRKRIFLENQVIQTKKEVTEIENIYSDMRGLRHDMQSHINSILLYVRNIAGKNSNEIESYVGKIQETLGKLDFSYHSGNPIIDIIIHQAQQRAKQEGISFCVNFVYPKTKEKRDKRAEIRDLETANDSYELKSSLRDSERGVAIHNNREKSDERFEECSKSLHMRLPQGMAACKLPQDVIATAGGVRRMSDGRVTEPEEPLNSCHIHQSLSKDLVDVYDIAVILNNALENAFEACQNLTGEKFINLHSYLKGNLFFIEIENDFDNPITFNEVTGLPESHKPDKNNHGVGLANIQKSAKKYLGDIDIEISSSNDRQRFNLTVMMKLF